MAEHPTIRPGASAAAFPRQARATMRLRGASIEVRDDGGNEVIRVGRGGVIHWECAADSGIRWWAIVMKGDSPFRDGSGSAGGAPGRKVATPIGDAANGDGTRTYSYAIMVSDGTQVVFRDPEVVVGPGDGGDGGGGGGGNGGDGGGDGG